MVVKRMSNVILYVQDINAEVPFYRDKLGLKVLYPEEADDYRKAGGWVELDAGGVLLALHDGAHGRVGDEAPKITFEVDDLERARQGLVNQGVDMGEIKEIAPGAWMCSGEDPEGFRFFLAPG